MQLLEELRKTEWAVLRHHPIYYSFFGDHEPAEGMWEKKSYADESNNLFPMDRFEFREDGEWAQVYELRKLD